MGHFKKQPELTATASVIESLPMEAAGFGNYDQQYQCPAPHSFGRRHLECRGYRDSTAVSAS